MHMVIYRKVYKDSAYILEKKETGLTRWLASYFVFIQKQTGNFLYTQTKFLPVVGGAVEGKTGRKSSLHKSSFLQHFTESSLACT